MKDKEPKDLFFSADESPVSLPSVEEAWSDMRKKLDEEMPDRAVFFTWKRMGLVSILLLLSISAFWFIERRGAGEEPVRKGTVSVARDSRKTTESDNKRPAGSVDQQETTDAGVEKEKPAAARTKARADEGKKEKTTDKGKTENTPAEQLDAKTDEEQTERATQGSPRENAANSWLTTTVVADLHRPRRDSILIWVNMPKRAGVITRTRPGKTKKLVPDDSTRILWAAGLQDSKSFPVGAQQPVDYNADLKKDIWFDYVPSPYFQYFISRKIGFQVGLQFNNPQYTESVSIFKKKGTVTGFFSNDTNIVVRKLYYLSIPLTVYYSPFRNFSLGAGLQFSNLSNGVALQNSVVHYIGAGSGQRDTVTGIKLISLKEYRPAYSNLKKTDWRALFEMNYYWKRITPGVQYQQGLSDYLYTPVDGSTGKDKNSSFNVYLRYNLWERRIRN